MAPSKPTGCANLPTPDHRDAGPIRPSGPVLALGLALYLAPYAHARLVRRERHTYVDGHPQTRSPLDVEEHLDDVPILDLIRLALGAQ